MLKISVINEESQTTLVVEGKLVGPWVDELEKTWDGIRTLDGKRKVVLDLMDVTLVSEQGQELLRQMMTAGTTFKCCRGVHTKHLVKNLLHGCGQFSRTKEWKG